MKTRWLLMLMLLSAVSCKKLQDSTENKLRISAAASLTDLLAETSLKFETETGTGCELNFASSSILARQIENGINCDLFISAHPQWIRYLIEKGKIAETGVQDIFSNSLIIIVPSESQLKIESVNDLRQDQIRTIAMGDPGHVPAGIYAKKALEKAGIWPDMQQKAIGLIDVRAALAYVQNGSADCAIVYASDLYERNNVKPLLKIPDTLVPDIKYVAGIIKDGNKNLAKKFETFLMDSAQQVIIKKYGFITK